MKIHGDGVYDYNMNITNLEIIYIFYSILVKLNDPIAIMYSITLFKLRKRVPINQ